MSDQKLLQAAAAKATAMARAGKSVPDTVVRQLEDHWYYRTTCDGCGKPFFEYSLDPILHPEWDTVCPRCARLDSDRGWADV